MQLGPAQRFDRRENGDLWRQVEKPVKVAWIKSHYELDEALRRGFPQEDHLGNAMADVEVGRQATLGRLSAAAASSEPSRRRLHWRTNT